MVCHLSMFRSGPTLTLLEELRNHVARRATIGFGLEVQNEAVGQNGGRDRTHIIIRWNRRSARCRQLSLIHISEPTRRS